MVTNMKSGMKKVGWTIVSLLPVLMYFGLQLCCAIGVMSVLAVRIMLGARWDMDMDTLQALLMEQYFENIVPVLIVSQLVSLLAFGLWYYFVWGRKKRPEGTEKPQVHHILLIVVLGIALQFAISDLLSLVEAFNPGALKEYQDMLELAGITEFSALTLFATVVLAPLSEELACRGVIYRLAGKVSPKFWVANIIQALAFGILHGNLIQGAYAFALGIILGLVYRQFQNIWLCMLLHAAMNGSSVLVGLFYGLFPESWVGAVTVVTMVLAAALAAVCIHGIVKKPRAVA